MKLLITGGTGFIGQALVEHLHNHGHELTLISRQERDERRFCPKRYLNLKWLRWDFSTQRGAQGIEPHDAVINLAGAGIADKPWSESRKQLLRQSRIGYTKALVKWLTLQSWQPITWLNASAIGYYGTGTESVTEASPAGNDFAAQLCADWEAVIEQDISWPCRKVLMRFGVVLGDGGMLKKLKPSFMFGMGARLGAGQQGFSWIHLDDLINAVKWLLDNPAFEGPVNVTAPEPVNNKAFTDALAKTMHRPAWMVMPAPVVKLIFGEMGSTLLLSGQWVHPERLQQLGFAFKYPDINTALDSIFR